jgi:hypothetical protein
VLGGDFLCQVLDQPRLKIRILGQTGGPTLEPRITLFATGNNLTLLGDVVRRAVIARMDAACAEPWRRQFRATRWAGDGRSRPLHRRRTHGGACVSAVGRTDTAAAGIVYDVVEFGAQRNRRLLPRRPSPHGGNSGGRRSRP